MIFLFSQDKGQCMFQYFFVREIELLKSRDKTPLIHHVVRLKTVLISAE